MKVIVVGAGITGPLLAMLLKHKGFDPVVYERHSGIPAGGLAVSLSPQSFKVLDIIGLANDVLALGLQWERMIHRSEISGKVLQDIPIRERVVEMTGWPMAVLVRAKYCQFLVDSAQKRGIPFYWSKKLVDVKQEGDKVTAIFDEGTSDVADLLVGCDGLHSKVRDALFGTTPAEYTGIVGAGGFTQYTDDLRPPTQPKSDLVWGKGCFFLSIPTADNKYFWAVNLAEQAEMLEDWRTADAQRLDEMITALPAAQWRGNVGQMIRSSKDIVRFGLYLRPIPEVWWKGRAVLVGDAAHPITPFLGQGANQATEDVYHLVRVLVQNQPLNNESIEKAFAEYTAIRRPKAVKAVEQSKVEAQYRMAKTDEEIEARDEMRARGLNSDTWKVLLEALNGPYTGKSEI